MSGHVSLSPIDWDHHAQLVALLDAEVSRPGGLAAHLRALRPRPSDEDRRTLEVLEPAAEQFPAHALTLLLPRLRLDPKRHGAWAADLLLRAPEAMRAGRWSARDAADWSASVRADLLRLAHVDPSGESSAALALPPLLLLWFSPRFRVGRMTTGRRRKGGEGDAEQEAVVAALGGLADDRGRSRPADAQHSPAVASELARTLAGVRVERPTQSAIDGFVRLAEEIDLHADDASGGAELGGIDLVMAAVTDELSRVLDVFRSASRARHGVDVRWDGDV